MSYALLGMTLMAIFGAILAIIAVHSRKMEEKETKLQKG